jgi:hypothetical protein
MNNVPLPGKNEPEMDVESQLAAMLGIDMNEIVEEPPVPPPLVQQPTARETVVQDQTSDLTSIFGEETAAVAPVTVPSKEPEVVPEPAISAADSEDILVCGKCRAVFQDVEAFVVHKKSACKSNGDVSKKPAKKAGSRLLRPPPAPKASKEYDVERILSKRYNVAIETHEYLLKWRGLPDEHNTWEPLGNLSCSKLLEEFESRWRTDNQPVSTIHKSPSPTSPNTTGVKSYSRASGSSSTTTRHRPILPHSSSEEKNDAEARQRTSKARAAQVVKSWVTPGDEVIDNSKYGKGDYVYGYHASLRGRNIPQK